MFVFEADGEVGVVSGRDGEEEFPGCVWGFSADDDVEVGEAGVREL